MTGKDAHGGNFGWKYATVNKDQGGSELDLFFYLSLGVLIAVFVLTTMVAALLDAEWSFWHWLSLGVLGIIPAIFTVLLGIGFVANRFR